jgi:hypothetical protein
MTFIAPTQSPWEQMLEEITKPSAEQIALWKACDEYNEKTKQYGD